MTSVRIKAPETDTAIAVCQLVLDQIRTDVRKAIEAVRNGTSSISTVRIRLMELGHAREERAAYRAWEAMQDGNEKESRLTAARGAYERDMAWLAIGGTWE